MIIRPAKPADLPQLRAIYAPYVLHTTVSFEYRVPSREEFAARFARITRRFPWLVAEEDGCILGYAYGDLPFARAAYAWDAETSIYIRQDCRGRGLGRALYAALEPQLAEMGFCNLYAIVTGEKFGRWHSTVWLLKVLAQEPGPAPLPPADPRDC